MSNFITLPSTILTYGKISSNAFEGPWSSFTDADLIELFNTAFYTSSAGTYVLPDGLLILIKNLDDTTTRYEWKSGDWVQVSTDGGSLIFISNSSGTMYSEGISYNISLLTDPTGRSHTPKKGDLIFDPDNNTITYVQSITADKKVICSIEKAISGGKLSDDGTKLSYTNQYNVEKILANSNAITDIAYSDGNLEITKIGETTLVPIETVSDVSISTSGITVTKNSINASTSKLESVLTSYTLSGKYINTKVDGEITDSADEAEQESIKELIFDIFVYDETTEILTIDDSGEIQEIAPEYDGTITKVTTTTVKDVLNSRFKYDALTGILTLDLD